MSGSKEKHGVHCEKHCGTLCSIGNLACPCFNRKEREDLRKGRKDFFSFFLSFYFFDFFDFFHFFHFFHFFDFFDFFDFLPRERVKRHPFWRYGISITVLPKRYSGTRDGVYYFCEATTRLPARPNNKNVSSTKNFFPSLEMVNF